MVIVKRLTKIYHGKKSEVTALDDVSFTLPDEGLVFVVGKSGSGKSTLLNLLGGLDRATSGEINVDGFNFSDVKSEAGFDAFRARSLGFVFQDFHLIDRLTVFQNVEFALECKETPDSDRVLSALKAVGLEGCENRYPSQLSGGQQQRVAIARALIKDPRVILADEPTGNLDSVTALMIFEELKKLSADRLIVVVTHSLESARRFGDRIIELGDGKIVGDKLRCGEELPLVTDGVVNLPEGKLSEADLALINAAVSKGGVKVTQQDAFRDADEQYPSQDISNVSAASQDEKEAQSAPREICDGDPHDVKRAKHSKKGGGKRKYKISFKRLFGFALKFLRVPSFIVTAFATSVIAALFALCVIVYDFDANSVYSQLGDTQSGIMILQKGYCSSELENNLRSDKQARVSDEDIAAFENAAGNNVYKLYNISVPAREYIFDMGNMPKVDRLYKYFYSAAALGVMSVDEQYLKDVFGEYEVIAGALDLQPYGIIITDYVADSIAFAHGTLGMNDPYESFVGKDKWDMRCYINAVISTGYRERYGKLMDLFAEAVKDGDVTDAEIEIISSSELYVDFIQEAQSKLNIAYTLNDDIAQAMRDAPMNSRPFAKIQRAEMFDDLGNRRLERFGGYVMSGDLLDLGLKDNEVRMSLWLYNAMFGTYLTQDDLDKFEQKSFTVRDYDACDLDRANPLYEKTFVVTGLFDGGEAMFASAQTVYELSLYDTYVYALAVKGKESVADVLDVAQERGFLPGAMEFNDLYNIIRIMRVYCDLFLALGIALLAVGLTLLVAFGIRNVRGNSYHIGVMRALGAGGRDVMTVFLIQQALITIAICLVSVALQAGFVYLFDKVLVTGLADILNNNLLRGITLIAFDPVVLVISLAAIIGIAAFSVLLPIWVMGRVKPVDILTPA